MDYDCSRVFSSRAHICILHDDLKETISTQTMSSGDQLLTTINTNLNCNLITNYKLLSPHLYDSN